MLQILPSKKKKHDRSSLCQTCRFLVNRWQPFVMKSAMLVAQNFIRLNYLRIDTNIAQIDQNMTVSFESFKMPIKQRRR
jgi:hypothetical protein